jgi:hypothetical protein
MHCSSTVHSKHHKQNKKPTDMDNNTKATGCKSSKTNHICARFNDSLGDNHYQEGCFRRSNFLPPLWSQSISGDHAYPWFDCESQPNPNFAYVFRVGGFRGPCPPLGFPAYRGECSSLTGHYLLLLYELPRPGAREYFILKSTRLTSNFGIPKGNPLNTNNSITG